MREYGDPGDPGDPSGDHGAWSGPDGDLEPITAEDFLGPDGIPPDARWLGLDRNTQEGALIAFAGSLDASKPLHKAVAWVLLLAFAVPTALGIARPLY